MSTTADFYDGRGPRAVWLGSLQGDADPATVRGVACGRLLLDATDPLTYGDAVADLLDVWADEDHGHGCQPDGGWPWLWPDSRDADWVFTFVQGRVWITTRRGVSACPTASVAVRPDNVLISTSAQEFTMSEAVSTETPLARQTMSAAEHCAAAEAEFANAQHLYTSDPDKYRRAMDFASTHLRTPR